MRTLRATVVLSALAVGRLAFAQALPSTGLQFLTDTAYQSIPLAATPLLGNLPPEADLSDRFPPPGDQGRQSSCVAWAVAALKGYQEATERGWIPNVASHQFSPAYVYNQINKTPDCQGGLQYVDALNLLRREGMATLADFPYLPQSCSTIPNALAKQNARAFAIAEWRRVNLQDEVEMKTQIASGFPVLVGMMVDTAFAQLGRSVYRNTGGTTQSGHAMVAVGYDDSRSAFKLINSWGRNWGEDGFGWVDYGLFRQLAREAYVAQDIVTTPVRPEPPQPLPPLQPGPKPSPAPQPTSFPSASIGIPSVIHNVSVAGGQGAVPGMQITVPAQIQSARGQTAQIVIKFNYWNGPPLFANPQEHSYRDVGGLVATGLPPTVVGSDFETLDGQLITIPYYALNFQPTNGAQSYVLSLTAYLYLNNQLAAQSLPIQFNLRW